MFWRRPGGLTGFRASPLGGTQTRIVAPCTGTKLSSSTHRHHLNQQTKSDGSHSGGDLSLHVVSLQGRSLHSQIRHFGERGSSSGREETFSHEGLAKGTVGIQSVDAKFPNYYREEGSEVQCPYNCGATFKWYPHAIDLKVDRCPGLKTHIVGRHLDNQMRESCFCPTCGEECSGFRYLLTHLGWPWRMGCPHDPLLRQMSRLPQTQPKKGAPTAEELSPQLVTDTLMLSGLRADVTAEQIIAMFEEGGGKVVGVELIVNKLGQPAAQVVMSSETEAMEAMKLHQWTMRLTSFEGVAPEARGMYSGSTGDSVAENNKDGNNTTTPTAAERKKESVATEWEKEWQSHQAEGGMPSVPAPTPPPKEEPSPPTARTFSATREEANEHGFGDDSFTSRKTVSAAKRRLFGDGSKDQKAPWQGTGGFQGLSVSWARSRQFRAVQEHKLQVHRVEIGDDVTQPAANVTNLIVKNFPQQMLDDSEPLFDFFSQFGTVVDIRVIRSKVNMPMSFVKMHDVMATGEALRKGHKSTFFRDQHREALKAIGIPDPEDSQLLAPLEVILNDRPVKKGAGGGGGENFTAGGGERSAMSPHGVSLLDGSSTVKVMNLPGELHNDPGGILQEYFGAHGIVKDIRTVALQKDGTPVPAPLPIMGVNPPKSAMKEKPPRIMCYVAYQFSGMATKAIQAENGSKHFVRQSAGGGTGGDGVNGTPPLEPLKVVLAPTRAMKASTWSPNAPAPRPMAADDLLAELSTATANLKPRRGREPEAARAEDGAIKNEKEEEVNIVLQPLQSKTLPNNSKCPLCVLEPKQTSSSSSSSSAAGSTDAESAVELVELAADEEAETCEVHSTREKSHSAISRTFDSIVLWCASQPGEAAIALAALHRLLERDRMMSVAVGGEVKQIRCDLCGDSAESPTTCFDTATEFLEHLVLFHGEVELDWLWATLPEKQVVVVDDAAGGEDGSNVADNEDAEDIWEPSGNEAVDYCRKELPNSDLVLEKSFSPVVRKRLGQLRKSEEGRYQHLNCLAVFLPMLSGGRNEWPFLTASSGGGPNSNDDNQKEENASANENAFSSRIRRRQLRQLTKTQEGQINKLMALVNAFAPPGVKKPHPPKKKLEAPAPQKEKPEDLVAEEDLVSPAPDDATRVVGKPKAEVEHEVVSDFKEKEEENNEASGLSAPTEVTTTAAATAAPHPFKRQQQKLKRPQPQGTDDNDDEGGFLSPAASSPPEEKTTSPPVAATTTSAAENQESVSAGEKKEKEKVKSVTMDEPADKKEIKVTKDKKKDETGDSTSRKITKKKKVTKPSKTSALPKATTTTKTPSSARKTAGKTLKKKKK